MTQKMAQCAWWNRWHHRRLRRIDRQVMVPALRAQANALAAEDFEVGSSDWHDAVNVYMVNVWLTFTNEPGQEHWRCECAREDRVTF